MIGLPGWYQQKPAGLVDTHTTQRSKADQNELELVTKGVAGHSQDLLQLGEAQYQGKEYERVGHATERAHPDRCKRPVKVHGCIDEVRPSQDPPHPGQQGHGSSTPSRNRNDDRIWWLHEGQPKIEECGGLEKFRNQRETTPEQPMFHIKQTQPIPNLYQGGSS